MGFSRLPGSDPRTIARDIPGILDSLFPQLAPGVVTYLNRRASVVRGCARVSSDDLEQTTLPKAMLFEVAVAAAEQLLVGREEPDWAASLALALARQRRHFRARDPGPLHEQDRALALQVAQNLACMLTRLRGYGELVVAPEIPGYQWIVSGVGDFAVGEHLIEVKCTSRNFSSSDYRQVLIYWLLSYAAAIDRGAQEWTHVSLLNPRHGTDLTLSYDELIRLLASGRSKVELNELFATVVDERRVHKVT